MAYAIFSQTQQLPDWLKQNEFWINMFAYSHAMINPIIYITFNENFKKSFKKFLCCSNEVIPYEYSRNCEYNYFKDVIQEFPSLHAILENI